MIEGYDFEHWNGDESDIDGFIEAVKETLNYWLKWHTEPETWAENWLIGESASYIFEKQPILKNDYLTFDWREAAIKIAVENLKEYFVVCPECDYTIKEELWNDHLEEQHEGDDIEYTDELNDYHIDEIIDFLIDCEHQPTEDELEESLITAGFETYRNALKIYTEGIEEEIQDLFTEYDNAETKQDLWLVVMKMLSIYHVHGKIIEDYAGNVGLDYQFACNVREYGGTETFGEDEFLEWLND